MEEDEQEEEDDSQALSQEPLPEAPQEEDTAPAYLVRDSGIPPLRAVDMMKAMQLVGGDDYIQAALDADKRLGTDRLRLKVYSERTGGTARKERLKRKAADITRSACETFAYCTSRTTSIEDTAMLLSAFANVSDTLK